ncbi:MAG: FtsQ-type POTRA domain-containing protein [Clostridia bacterium]|nr:FtsQ-type POTRA domain-containing protein [Clostridia bacterium]
MSQMPLPQGYMPFEGESAPPPPARKKSGLRTAVISLLLFACLVILLNESVFKIHHVAVVGLESVAWEDAVRAAGLDRPTNYFTVNENRIRSGINATKDLVFEKMEKQFPDRLVLYVRERVPCAYLQVMGNTYKIDNEGMVLERLPGMVQPAGDLITISGFSRANARVGQMLTAPGTEYMEAFTSLMREIELQGVSDQVAELNLADPDSLYLITVDGYTAALGDANSLRAKIGTVRAVVDKLREMGKTGGMLDASRPGEVIYTPAGP